MAKYDYSIEKEKIVTALSTSDINTLAKLMKDVSSNVRRAVASNINTTKEMLELLAFDPAKNVSVTALRNKNCDCDREVWEESHPCLECQKKISNLKCHSCKDIASFSY
ncbi:MAG: hypothetical protein ACQERD_11940 [Campylobacterota bacterium]